MSTIVFTNTINRIIAAPTVLNGATVGVVLMREAPDFEDGDARYLGAITLADLTSTPGWLVGSVPADTETISLRTDANNRYALWTQVNFTGIPKQEVKAAIVYYVGTLNSVVNPILLVTNTPFGGRAVVNPVDGLTSNPDNTLTGSNRYILSWAAPGGVPVANSFSGGPFSLAKGAPDYESSHAQHVWLIPQRANMIANPSFEATGMDFWSGNGTLSRVAEPSADGGAWAGRFTAASGYAIAESNVFPTIGYEGQFTIQLMAKGTGILKVGLVWWRSEFENTFVEWGVNTMAQSWTLDPTTYTPIRCLRAPPDAYQAMLRLELQGAGPLTLDRVLVEKGTLMDWPYFDGSTTFGARDDFSWYGGAARQGATYSMWYNNRRATYGRLFARDVADDVLLTDAVNEDQGLVYQWVPAGTTVIPHMDVLYAGDLQATVPAKAAGVQPYKVTDSPTGVVNPWV